MQQRQVAARLHLTAGFEEMVVEHWFVKEGERVRSLAPLITLRHHSTGLAVTQRAPVSGMLTGAVIQQILRSEGTPVSAGEILAVLTKTLPDEERAIAHLGTLEPAPYPYTAAMGIGVVVTSSSRIRDALFRRFPGYRRFYFQTYPLLPLLRTGVFAIIGILCALQIQHLFAQVSNTPASGGSDGVFLVLLLFFTLLVLIPIVLAVILPVIRLLFLRPRL